MTEEKKEIIDNIKALKEGESTHLWLACQSVLLWRGKYELNLNGYESKHKNIKCLLKKLGV